MKGINIKIRDNDETLDRYTVMITDSETTHFYGMSTNALGFNLYCGNTLDGYEDGDHLGIEVDFHELSPEVQNAIIQRIRRIE